MRDTWKAQAACVGMDPHLFFPILNDRSGPMKAMLVCWGCSVRLQCLEYALRNGEDFGKFGIWGGTTEQERRGILRQQGELIHE